MRRSVYSALRRVFERFPAIRPVFRFINRNTFKLQQARPITFAGWGMQTEHSVPWDDPSWQQFLETNKHVRAFEFAPGFKRQRSIDELRWRHWTVCWAIEYATRFSARKETPFTMVECGVAVGITSFFALRQAESKIGRRNYRMHLYDSWSEMRGSQLLPDEAWLTGAFSYNSLERAQSNLKDYEDVLVFHPGYIPEVFEGSGHPEEGVHYLSIDLDSANATSDALEYFFPRMARNGIILVHDFGHIAFSSVRHATIEFLRDKPGLLFPQASGQAIFLVAP